MSSLKVLRLSARAKLPTYATDGSACFDFYAAHDALLTAYHAALIGTDLAVEVPEDYVLQMYPRSGLAFRHLVTLANSPAIIDADYRGEVKFMLVNHGPKPVTVLAGDRVAQAMLVHAPRVAIEEVAELSETERGTGGFGSTGR